MKNFISACIILFLIKKENQIGEDCCCWEHNTVGEEPGFKSESGHFLVMGSGAICFTCFFTCKMGIDKEKL